MEENKQPRPSVKVEIRPAPNILKILLILLILFSMAALMALRWVHNGIQAEIDTLKEEAAAIEHDNSVLDEKTKDPDSIENIQNIAKEELGLVDPDTIIIDPQ